MSTEPPGPHPWTPEPRPGWLTGFNAIAAGTGGPGAVVPLAEGSLLDAAAQVAGTADAGTTSFSSDAFGGEAWLEGFRILLEDLSGTARLNLMGRILVRTELVRSLVTRARMREAFALHPDIAEQEVRGPLFVTGMGRSGTSITHELLACDPALRAPQTWELLFPGLPSSDRSTPQQDPVAAADAQHTFWDYVTPEYRTMHENSAEAPNECAMGLLADFRSTTWGGAHSVPNYDMWLALGDPAPMFDFHRRLLQLLQFRRPGRWVLKDPMHLARIPAIFERYPDARVVITHRDPVKVLPSVHNLMATLRWQRSDEVDAAGLARMLASAYPAMWDRVIELRRSGSVPEDRIVDLHYADLMADPMDTVGGLYDSLGMALTVESEAAMAAHLGARPKDRHGPHRYSFDDMGMDPEAVRESFAGYMQTYGVAAES